MPQRNDKIILDGRVQESKLFIKHKPRLRADGSLLPSALRPGLEKVKKFYKKHFKICEYQKTSYGFKLTIISINFVLALIISFFFQNPYANNASAASLTLSIPSTLSLNISDPSANGGFNKSTTGTIGVKTDASSGYTLSIKAKTNNELTNGSTKLTSISSAVSESDFSSKGEVNTWGYLPSKLNSLANSNFLPGPTSKSSVIEETNEANSDTANNYTITLGSKIDDSTPSGSYSNTFILTAVANKPKGCILDGEEKTSFIDTRDNNEYTIATLNDGKCWMTQNLKIGSNSSTTTLTSDNTDISSSYTLPQGSTSGFSDDSAENIYIDSSAGGYYTYNAATAGTGNSISSGEASGSICPKGWRLPTKTEIDNLESKNGGDNTSSAGAYFRSSPANFTLSGYYFSSSLYGSGSYGYWWSSTATSSTGACYLHVVSSFARWSNNSRRNGASVRCVAREETSYNITYNGNSGSNIPSTQTGKVKAGSVKLSDQSPTRSGYKFKGWCDKETSDSTCSGNTYQPGGNIPITEGSENNITLYAMWQKSSCPNAVTECSLNGYSGKRFGSGKCWMSTDFKTSVQWSSNFGCPSGWSTPTKSDFDNLISNSQAGSGACLYEEGWNGDYWSSTYFGNYSGRDSYYALYVLSSSAYVSGRVSTNDINVRCVSS